MEIAEIAEFARNFAVMVRVQGPDPKALKMIKHAFHSYHNGMTTLSASGMLLPTSLINPSFTSKPALVVTVASVVEPFLPMQHRENYKQAIPQLIPGAQIDILVENKKKRENNLDEHDRGTSQWVPSNLLALVDVPASSLALQSLIGTPGVSPEIGPWEIGWSMAPSLDGPHGYTEASKTQVGQGANFLIENDKRFARNMSTNHSRLPRSIIRVAFLEVPSLTSEDVPDICTSPPNKRGDLLVAVGSPFGILSPVHFFNSISVGSISNCYPSSAYNSSLLMADSHCLPGMEGGPVFGKGSHLVGILNRPLRQKADGVEIQLVIPWEAIAIARSDLLENGTQNSNMVMNSNNPESIRTSYVNKNQSHITPALQIENTMASIALLTTDDGSWASGVVLNNHGLILTNAHLLEPWRFGKTGVQHGGNGAMSASLPVTSMKPAAVSHGRSDGQQEIHSVPLEMVKVSDTSFGDEGGRYKLGSVHKSYKKIRARLDHLKPPVWYEARVVYISQGPLDVALLQLESVHNHLCPIIPDFSVPSPGAKAYVIGHGLFGPRSYLYPSVWSGVVSQVVISHDPLPTEAGSHESKTRYLPAMLQTTAAVHSGASGGAIVNSDGHMIGIVTSNSRHGGGTLIPHLNYSIPCAALEPIFKFSEDMRDLTILLSLEKPNEHLSSVWAMLPPMPSSSVQPHQYQLRSISEGNKEGKGSRFAKFIAERQSENFLRSNKLPKVGKSSNPVRTSKL